MVDYERIWQLEFVSKNGWYHLEPLRRAIRKTWKNDLERRGQ
jgi:hypothetical protein